MDSVKDIRQGFNVFLLLSTHQKNAPQNQQPETCNLAIKLKMVRLESSVFSHYCCFQGFQGESHELYTGLCPLVYVGVL